MLIFDTTKDAVDCSIEMQHTVKNIANLDLRIGIHQGEVVIQGDDVIGDDVNVASRVEPFASPGGVVITNRVNASLLRDPVYKTKLIGEPKLKGVRQDVKLHCIVSHGLPETDLSKVQMVELGLQFKKAFQSGYIQKEWSSINQNGFFDSLEWTWPKNDIDNSKKTGSLVQNFFGAG